MREPTKDELYELQKLQGERQAAFKALLNIRGPSGGGAEARHVAAVEAEYHFRESVLGETGIMR